MKGMQDNKSLGEDRIPPKLLLVIVEHNSIPLATVFNLSLEEGMEWKEVNNISLLQTQNIGELYTSELNIGALQIIRQT